MKAEWNEVLKAALELPMEARERLIEELAASLDDEGPAISDEMAHELAVRFSRMRAGERVDADDIIRRPAR